MVKRLLTSKYNRAGSTSHTLNKYGRDGGLEPSNYELAVLLATCKVISLHTFSSSKNEVARVQFAMARGYSWIKGCGSRIIINE